MFISKVINENSYIVNNESRTILDLVERAIKKYEIHPSILLIKNKIGNQKPFKFEAISDIEKEIKTINPQKATLSENIPPKILNPIQDRGGKNAPYQFFPCNFYRVGISPPNFLSFSFNPFTTVM